MSSAPPKQLATPEDTFTALAAQFNFDTRIKDKILELGIRALAEFRHYPRTDEEVKKLFVDSLSPSMEEIPARLHSARLRFAWNSCKAMLDAEHAAASLPPASTEDETLLPTSELDSLKEAFYKRYHIRPEPRQFPSDRLLSKLSRQLYRGQLEVMDLWTVRSLTFQRTHSQKRRKVGDGLYLQEDDTEEDMSKTWLAYLMKLETYLLALAIVGCRPRDPPPTTPESLSSDSLDYVQVPYDTLFRYYARCQDLVYRTADSKRLSVLQHLDVEERGQWSARTAVGTSLGSVIHAVHRERDALWIAGALPGPVVGVGGGTPAPSSAAGSRPPDSAGRAGSVVHSLRDGTALCQEFQRGRCKNKRNDCPKGVHRCGVLLKSGRVCGSWQHAPARCPSKA